MEPRVDMPSTLHRAERALRIAAVCTVIALIAACASPMMASEGPGTTRDTSLGKVLTDAKGMTLYTYDKDQLGKSNCTGMCAVFWPPVMAADNAKLTGEFTLVARDGTKQWAYKGKPLYTYLPDSKPGDVAGDGADGVWHAAKF